MSLYFLLFRAVELNNGELVSLILKSTYGTLALKFTDSLGRTTLCHATKYPELLKYLLETAEELLDKV